VTSLDARFLPEPEMYQQPALCLYSDEGLMRSRGGSERFWAGTQIMVATMSPQIAAPACFGRLRAWVGSALPWRRSRARTAAGLCLAAMFAGWLMMSAGGMAATAPPVAGQRGGTGPLVQYDATEQQAVKSGAPEQQAMAPWQQARESK
jgi:hypothetical protein